MHIDTLRPLFIALLLGLALPLQAQVDLGNSSTTDNADTPAEEEDPLYSQVDDSCTQVVIHTTMGTIRVALYNDTPLHRDNFIRLAETHFYDSLLIHRVVPSFVVQGGDSLSRHALPGAKVGDTDEPYTVACEVRYPRHYHKCGALAMAREEDSKNPDRASSAYQFYIVTGRIYDDASLDKAQEYLDKMAAAFPAHHPEGIKLTPTQREAYKTLGGMPYLDGQYTVFGEVTEGLDVVYNMQWVARDGNDRPDTDIRILSTEVIRPK